MNTNFRRKRPSLGKASLLLFSVLPLLLVGCSGKYKEEKNELEAAFAAYFEVSNQVVLTGDTSLAEAVATGDMLEKIETNIEMTGGTLNEVHISTVDVEHASDTDAVASIRYEYQEYYIDQETGERIYYSDLLYYHTVRVTFVWVSNVWKVQNIETIDWTK